MAFATRATLTTSVERRALGACFTVPGSSDLGCPAQEKAECPVSASPRTRVWMSCVPSYV